MCLWQIENSNLIILFKKREVLKKFVELLLHKVMKFEAKALGSLKVIAIKKQIAPFPPKIG